MTNGNENNIPSSESTNAENGAPLDALSAEIHTAPDEKETAAPGGKAAQDITKGPILPWVIKLALPTMGAIAFHASYSIVDTIWVGRYIGKEGISAISIWFYMFMVFVFFNQLIGIGSVALISQSYGAKKFEQTKIVIGQTFMFKFYMAVLVAVLGWLFAGDVYRGFIADAEVQRLGIAYSLILFTALPVYFSGFTLNTAFRGIGDMKYPLYIAGASTILNIILDPILIVGINSSLHPAIPDLTRGFGIVGAAAATVIAQTFTFTFSTFIFFSGRTFIKMELKYLGLPIWHWIKRIVQIGTPTAIGEGVRNIAMLIIGKWVALFGTAIFAAQGIMGQFFMLVWIPLGGIGQAVVTLVGQNLGARKPWRGEESVWKSVWVALAIIIPIVILGEFHAPGLIQVFNTEPDVIYAGTKILRVILIVFIPLAVSGIVGSAFWGSGDTTYPMIVGVVNVWLVQLPLIWVAMKLALHPVVRLSVVAGGHEPIYYAWWVIVFSEVLAAAALVWLFKLGLWKKAKI